MHGEAPDTMEALRAALLAMEHRATTAEATVAALMAGAAEEFAALRDAAVAEEREACARMCEAEARRLAAMVAHGNHVAGFAAEKVGDVAADIRARAPQPPPQRPEAPRDGATPAPDAPSPAGCLPVAATRRCPACNGRGVRRYTGGTVDGCDGCGLLSRVVAEGGGR